MKIVQARKLWWLVVGVVLMTASACAMEPTLTDHAFGFDVVRESPNIEIVDYRYGNSRQPGARPEGSRVAQGTGINGPMMRGDFLYVKWRVKSTGEVYEDTVDLRSRLPADITNHRIHFVIKGSQLYVYLISPEPNPPGWPTYDPPGYTHKKTYVIYPDQPKF